MKNKGNFAQYHLFTKEKDMNGSSLINTDFGPVFNL